MSAMAFPDGRVRQVEMQTLNVNSECLGMIVSDSRPHFEGMTGLPSGKLKASTVNEG